MSRPLLVLTVALAGYAVVSSILGAGVAAFCRRRGLDAHSATTLARLRLLPAGAAFVVTAAIVVPAFVIFEPVRESEPVGPMVIALALFTLLLAGSAGIVAMRTLFQTLRLERLWLRSATPVANPSTAMTTYVIDSAAPLVALIGVFSPRLVAARTVVDACSPEEFAVIVAHERGHLRARDNLTRWLLICAPDVLRWSSLHRDLLDAWRHASEDAADDAATADDAERRADLAALLVKVARLGIPGPAPATVSPFADPDGLERRVRRLIATDGPPPPNRWPGGAVALVVALAASLLTQPGVLQPAYELIEFTIHYGRW